MKRSEMIQILEDFLWKSNGDYGYKHLAKQDAINLLELIEEVGMFYCPVEKLTEGFTLRVPKGFEE